MVKERNMYAKLLLHMVFIKDFTFPFNKSPNEGSLPPFPVQLKSKVKNVAGVHEGVFWRDIYSKIHPNADILSITEMESQIEAKLEESNRIVQELTFKNTELTSRILALESTCNKVCAMISLEGGDPVSNISLHSAQWILTTRRHYEAYKSLYESLCVPHRASVRVPPEEHVTKDDTKASSIGDFHVGRWMVGDGDSLSTIEPCDDQCHDPCTGESVLGSLGECVVPPPCNHDRRVEDLISAQKNVYIDELLTKLQEMNSYYGVLTRRLQEEMADQKCHYVGCIDMLQKKLHLMETECNAAKDMKDQLTQENMNMREELTLFDKKFASQTIYIDALLNRVSQLREASDLSRADTSQALERVLIQSIEQLALSRGHLPGLPEI